MYTIEDPRSVVATAFLGLFLIICEYHLNYLITHNSSSNLELSHFHITYIYRYVTYSRCKTRFYFKINIFLSQGTILGGVCCSLGLRVLLNLVKETSNGNGGKYRLLILIVIWMYLELKKWCDTKRLCLGTGYRYSSRTPCHWS